LNNAYLTFLAVKTTSSQPNPWCRCGEGGINQAKRTTARTQRFLYTFEYTHNAYAQYAKTTGTITVEGDGAMVRSPTDFSLIVFHHNGSIHTT